MLTPANTPAISIRILFTILTLFAIYILIFSPDYHLHKLSCLYTTKLYLCNETIKNLTIKVLNTTEMKPLSKNPLVSRHLPLSLYRNF